MVNQIVMVIAIVAIVLLIIKFSYDVLYAVPKIESNVNKEIKGVKSYLKRNYYIYQYLSKAFKKFGIEELITYKVDQDESISYIPTDNKRTDKQLPIHQLRKWLELNILFNTDIIIFVDKSKKKVEIIQYKEGAKMETNGPVILHRKGKFLIVIHG